MPKYLYTCTNCHTRFYFYHLMSEKRTDCEVCEISDTLVKLPSHFSLLSDIDDKKKVGDLVKKFIEESRDELNLEKEKVKNEFFEPDE